VDADRTLVVEAVAGSREAFDELVGRYRTRIYNLARILTGGDADAEDLVQDTFVRAFRAIGGFRGDSTFRTWLYRIAVNVIRSHGAHRSRRMQVVRTTPTPRSASPEDEREAEIERVASTEDLEATIVRRRMIDRALAALPEEMRTVITLRDVQGLEYHEIAEVTGLPMGTVESRVFRARQRLRPMLEPLMPGSRGEGRASSDSGQIVPIPASEEPRR
jgi:RNA polymerase sigma-70 factor (ECF subfamily)